MSIGSPIKRSELVRRALSVSGPLVMGILNTTPDSFSDGGQFLAHEKALHRVTEMVQQGAHIIDIGGESTRPGAPPVDLDTELERVIPILTLACKHFPDTLFSVDTTKYAVAEAAMRVGAHIINDVSGLRKEPELASLAARYHASLIIMHSVGSPQTMQQQAQYSDVVQDVTRFLKNQAEFAQQEGVEHLIIDPGFGFGKTLEHNLALIKGIQTLKKLGFPVLAGASRKSMIGALLNNRAVDGRLAGTLLVHYECLIHGADILRVHDVQEASDSVQIFKTLHS